MLRDYISSTRLADSNDVQAAYRALYPLPAAQKDIGLYAAKLLTDHVAASPSAHVAVAMIAPTNLMRTFAQVSNCRLVQKHFSENARDLAQQWIEAVNDTNISMNFRSKALNHIAAVAFTARLQKALDSFMSGDNEDADDFLTMAQAWNQAVEVSQYLSLSDAPSLKAELEDVVCVARQFITLPEDDRTKPLLYGASALKL